MATCKQTGPWPPPDITLFSGMIANWCFQLGLTFSHLGCFCVAFNTFCRLHGLSNDFLSSNSLGVIRILGNGY